MPTSFVGLTVAVMLIVFVFGAAWLQGETIPAWGCMLTIYISFLFRRQFDIIVRIAERLNSTKPMR